MTIIEMEGLFGTLQKPVLIFGYDTRGLFFKNSYASRLLDSVFSEDMQANGGLTLDDLLRCSRREDRSLFFDTLYKTGSVNAFRTVLPCGDRNINLDLWAGVGGDTSDKIILLFCEEVQPEESLTISDINKYISGILSAAFSTADVAEAINKVIAMAGGHMGICRVVVNEALEENRLLRRHVWCASGYQMLPEIIELDPEEYRQYREVLDDGMFIANDVSLLGGKFAGIIGENQSKAFAQITLHYLDDSIGSVSFHDCAATRTWSITEIRFISSVAEIIVALVSRRDAEEKLRINQKTMQIILDNIENIVYVNDPDTYEIAFINKTLEERIGVKKDEVIGRKCWAALKKDMEGPCPFCPIPHMRAQDGTFALTDYSWEMQNADDGHWFQIRDSMITWVNGKTMHLESATDITSRKKYEEQLQNVASIDAMTGVYNREWGFKVMLSMAEEAFRDQRKLSLCFIDLDGLKYVNDTQGHDSGDEMILRIIKAIRNRIRKNDVICRWGGDEFLVLFSCDVLTTERIMRSIQDELAYQNAQADYSYDLSFSYGVAYMQGGTAVQLYNTIAEADQLMYEQKMSKRK